MTQAVPAPWVDQMEKHDWIEDVIVDALRTGVETIGQEYIVARMRWLDEVETETPEIIEEREAAK